MDDLTRADIERAREKHRGRRIHTLESPPSRRSAIYVAICPNCGHIAPLDAGALTGRFGAALLIQTAMDRMRCRACNHLGAVFDERSLGADSPLPPDYRPPRK